MNKTLFLSDLDGTLLNGNAELSYYTKDALTRLIADGVSFSVATARTAASVLKILDGVRWRIPFILLNGVLVYDFPQRRYMRVFPLFTKTVLTIRFVLRQLDTTGLMYQLKNDELITYYEHPGHQPLRDFIEERKTRYHKVFREVNFADVPPEDIIYFTLLDTQDKIQATEAALSSIPGLRLSVYKDVYSPLWYLEMHSEKATKQSGAIWLRETFGFERIIGFGDNLNDLPMFAACDVSVAVSNAAPEVKAAADDICDTNDRDGVAKWIKGNIL